METTPANKNTTPNVAGAPMAARPASSSFQQRPGAGRPGAYGDRGGRTGGPRRGGPNREPRAKSEYDQKIISIRRVTRVAAGGRRFSFSVALVVGNRKGAVGVGIGKASDTSLAIDKALKNAKKNLVHVKLTKNLSIPYEVDAKYASSRVLIMPAKGKGIIAGSSVRNVIELAGITDVTAKIFSRSKNKLNNARVAIKALGEFTKPAPVAAPVQVNS